MAVSRRFIITELKNRNIYPGKSKDYAKDIFDFLLETFNVQEDVLEKDFACKESLKTISSDMSSQVKKYMKGTRLDRILAENSNHKVLKH